MSLSICASHSNSLISSSDSGVRSSSGSKLLIMDSCCRLWTRLSWTYSDAASVEPVRGFRRSLTRLADANRNRSPNYLYNSERINHDVLIVDMRNSWRKVERGKRRIHPECAKWMIGDWNEAEMTRIMINAAAGPAHWVSGKFDDLIVKVTVQSFHVWRTWWPLFFLL